MTSVPRADMVGIYITDDYVDVAVGWDDNDSSGPRRRLSALKIGHGDPLPKPFAFPKGQGGIKETFAEVGQWINSHTSKLSSIGVGCYGPFESISKSDRDAGRSVYGQLVKETSHGRLRGQIIPDLIFDGLGLSMDARKPVLLTVDTDVTAVVSGYAYNQRTLDLPENVDDPVEEQAFVFVKVSHGVGGAFMKTSTSWHGRLHPEMGQFRVPLWKDEATLPPSKRELARNPGSVEALASVGAIEDYYGDFEKLLKDPKSKVWDREAWYLAHLAWTITCCISPHRIIFGGRLMRAKGLIEKIRDVFQLDILGNEPFPNYDELVHVETYLTTLLERDGNSPERPGVVGALCMAMLETYKPRPPEDIRTRLSR